MVYKKAIQFAQNIRETMLSRLRCANYVGDAFHDSVEVGPKMVARVAKHTGLKPDDL